MKYSLPAIVKYLIDPELWGYFTIAGKEYFNEGYSNPNYRLFFPKAQPRKNLYPFSALENDDRKPLNFIDFNEAEHIVRAKVEETEETKEDSTPVDSFEPKAAPMTDSLADDFPTPGENNDDLALPFG